jgi:hypothetical protein
MASNMNRKICIVIPIYKKEISYYEQISFNRAITVFKSYDICLVAPENLDLQNYHKMSNSLNIRTLNNTYFKNTKTYSLLLCSKEFYSLFIKYEYILIYQLDAFVFYDDLQNWLNKKYDYVGSPWLNLNWLKNKTKFLFYFIKPFFRLVGNGGLSLRNVKKFYNISKYTSNFYKFLMINEDIWWSNIIPIFFKLNIPKLEDALLFSFEEEPYKAFKFTKGKLPFGCHAWSKDENIEFWRPIFRRYGYYI